MDRCGKCYHWIQTTEAFNERFKPDGYCDCIASSFSLLTVNYNYPSCDYYKPKDISPENKYSRMGYFDQLEELKVLQAKTNRSNK